MALPPKLDQELAELLESYKIEIQEESTLICLVFKEFPIGDGFNLPTTDLLLRVPLSYPDAGPDMFYTDPRIVLASGAIPQNAESLETYIGRQWRRFSWHHNRWNRISDNLTSYLEFVRERLRRKA